MEFPNCPTCGRGHLIPLSNGALMFAVWVCSTPDCNYAVSGIQTSKDYYKGMAVATWRDQGQKTWTEFQF